jgi:hypothetical protein
MLSDEPHLQLILANDLAYKQIVRTVIASFSRTARHRSRFLEHYLVRV